MKTLKMDIPASGTWKRDCVLTSIQIKPDLLLEFSKDSDSSNWKLFFSNYFSIKITSEEFTSDKCLRELPVDGSFYEIIDSPWIKELMWNRNKLLERSRHFVFCFYDEAIEVISNDFSIQKIEESWIVK